MPLDWASFYEYPRRLLCIGECSFFQLLLSLTRLFLIGEPRADVAIVQVPNPLIVVVDNVNARLTTLRHGLSIKQSMMPFVVRVHPFLPLAFSFKCAM